MGAPSNGFKQNMGENYMKTSEPLKFNRFNQKKHPSKNDGTDTRWAPTSCTWSHHPYKWPYKWVSGVTTPRSGVITLLIYW